jgi:hypothetical protein
MRSERDKILSSTKNLSNMGIKHSLLNSKNYDCGNYVFFKFNTNLDAKNFTSIFPAPIAGKTGRHNYTEWDQILLKEGSFHQSLNPYKLSENKKCRMTYSKDMCKTSLEILNKTIMIPTDPKNKNKDTNNTIRNIKKAALAYVNNENIKIKQKSIDIGKFDYSEK